MLVFLFEGEVEDDDSRDQDVNWLFWLQLRSNSQISFTQLIHQPLTQQTNFTAYPPYPVPIQCPKKTSSPTLKKSKPIKIQLPKNSPILPYPYPTLYIDIYIIIQIQKLPKKQMNPNQPNQPEQSHQPHQNKCEQAEILLENCDGSEDDLFFDAVVGALQDTVLEEEFVTIEEGFMKMYCGVFEDVEENKMEYMQIFNHYQHTVENYILQSLSAKVPNFSMQVFSALLATRTHQIDEDLLEMMNSFTSFEVFKQLMLEFKQYYGGEAKFQGLCVKGAVYKM